MVPTYGLLVCTVCGSESSYGRSKPLYCITCGGEPEKMEVAGSLFGPDTFLVSFSLEKAKEFYSRKEQCSYAQSTKWGIDEVIVVLCKCEGRSHRYCTGAKNCRDYSP